MIVPLSGGEPTHPIAPGGQPPGIWGGAPPYVDIGFPGPQPRPSHPIAPGGRPPGIWGGAPPYVDIGFPGPQPGRPGGQPPGIWGGGGVGDYIDAGFPGPQPGGPTYPSQGPGFPTQPIVIPVPPGEQPPEGGDGLTPSHPIVIPPSGGEGSGEHALVYTHIVGVGGVWFLIEKPAQTPPSEAQPKRGG
jgi:hypothetical protein